MPPLLRSALVTGAAGYVGATLVHHLLQAGTQVVGLDSLERGHADALPSWVPLVQGDVREPDTVREAILRFGRPPEACIHLAARSLVGESMIEPGRYHAVNAGGTQVVAEACLEMGVPVLTLASSAAVLGAHQAGVTHLDEDAFVHPASPHGASKLAAERTLQALAQTGRMSTVSLRLFNVAGVGYGCPERHDPETHLIPLAILAAAGRVPPLRLFGTDLPTRDGTCIRDYVHVLDVVEAMLRATARAVQLQASGESAYDLFHVGSGVGHTVREVLAVCEDVLGVPVPVDENPPRLGDVAEIVSKSDRLRQVLGIEPLADLRRMVAECALSLGVAVRG
ncbi:MAG: NAD-dependent epimerase/dehydratase family protein [Myxococcota bacterium]